MQDNCVILEGAVKEVIFTNEESGYQVLRFQPEKEQMAVTIVGNLAGLEPGEMLRLSGTWVRHPQFGRQFQVKDYSFLAPRSIRGLVRYLGSGMIRGLGPVIAKRIVQRFGLAALEILDKHPERLQEVSGIGEKKAARIIKSWERQKRVKDVMIFLQSYNISSGYANRIYRQYGHETIRVVKENPYLLARDVRGVGFKIADRIAASLGISRTSEDRLRAGLFFLLEEGLEEGNVYLPRNELIGRAADLLGVSEKRILPALERLGSTGVLITEGGRVYLPGLYQIELKVAGDLLRLADSPAKMEIPRAMKRLVEIEQQGGVRFSGEQKQAVVRSFTSGVLIVTGGPGTGKTTTVSGIIKVCEAENLKFALAAPTGRAAKRMSESTGRQAKTIHRLLEYSPRQGRFVRDENYPLAADVVIIDETSMLDIFLANGLFRALRDGTTLVLVGDSDQLPSVGAGNVLWDMIDSGRFPVVRLNRIFRQVRTSQIVLNAHRIKQGVIPRIKNSEATDFFFLTEGDPARAAAVIRDLAVRRLPEKYGLNPMKDIQVLSPMYRGELGVNNLNLLIQEALNPHGEGIAGGRFRLKDKVMQIKNNYEKNVFNGDIGIIEKVDKKESKFIVVYDGVPVEYDYEELEQLVPAYAISVHKSQGSEYPLVIMAVSTQHYIMLQRNLLYTGITRARRMVVLVGTKKALAIAVKNDKVVRRCTSLVERLRRGRG